MEHTRKAGMNRRRFLARSGVLAAAAALWQVPGLLRLRGWYDPAYALEPGIVRDTLNGLVAFVWPGDDRYSIHQGEQAGGPGAIAADTTTLLIQSLDRYVPAPHVEGLVEDETIPLSGAVANLLNTVALTVNPAAGLDRLPGLDVIPSPFSRLSFAEKAEVFRVLEEDTGLPDGELPEPFTRTSGNFQFVAGILPGFVAFLAFCEWQVFAPETRTLSGRPVGWDHTGYQDDRVVPVEGWDEFKGYYENRRSVTS